MLTVTQLYSLTANTQWPVNLSMLSTDKPATGYGIVASGVAYLYDMDWFGVSTLISHGPRNVWGGATPGQPMQLTIGMRTLCYDVPAGRYIGLGLNMYSDLYAPAGNSSDIRLQVHYDALSSVLQLPVIAIPA